MRMMEKQAEGFILEDLEKVRESIKAGYTPRNFTLEEWYGNTEKEGMLATEENNANSD